MEQKKEKKKEDTYYIIITPVQVKTAVKKHVITVIRSGEKSHVNSCFDAWEIHKELLHHRLMNDEMDWNNECTKTPRIKLA